MRLLNEDLTVQTTSEPVLPLRTVGGAEAVRLAVVVGALGVVFGDIGTSPIYTLATVFNPSDPHPVPLNTDNIYGVVSLLFWSVMTIVTLTYVTLVMHADNDGEGGIMALITLLRRFGGAGGRRTLAALAALGIFGAALFFGDSMITPAMSMLSAVEGLKVVEPSLEEWIVPITAVIILGLFAVQRYGTAAVGRLFGPVSWRSGRAVSTVSAREWTVRVRCADRSCWCGDWSAWACRRLLRVSRLCARVCRLFWRSSWLFRTAS